MQAERIKSLQTKLQDAFLRSAAADTDRLLARALKSEAELDSMIGEQKYSQGAYALRVAYAEQAFRNAKFAQQLADDELMAALEEEMAEIRKEDLQPEDLICRM